MMVYYLSRPILQSKDQPNSISTKSRLGVVKEDYLLLPSRELKTASRSFGGVSLWEILDKLSRVPRE